MSINTEHFKKELEKEEGMILSELKTVGRNNPNNPNDWQAAPDKMDTDRADEGEVANVLDSLEENKAIVGKLEARLEEVKAALDKITKNKYGICEVCAKPIEEARLEANPAAATCIADMK